MTNEEALEYMKKLSVILDLSGEYKQAMEVATESIDKQIPKNPVYILSKKKCYNIFDCTDEEMHEIVKSCPTCGWHPLETRYIRLHSCLKCNQKIDWGDEK